LTLFALRVGAQTPDTLTHKYALFSSNPNGQVDLVDLGRSVLKGHHAQRIDTVKQKAGKLHVSALPAAGYTLQTGFAGVVSSNFAFYTSDGAANLSNVLTSITYSQYNQIIFPIQANIWTKNNRYNIVTDWRYLVYPSQTYGLGGNTSADSGYNIDYGYLRLHQAILQHVAKDLYLGLGYDLDYFWNIREIDPPQGKETDFERYGLTKMSISSGISAHLLYDSRRNAINPDNGDYLGVTYRPNLTLLGSDNNWSSLIVDGRKYIPISVSNHDILAFWTYDWFTLGDGHPPYLLLPSTGWDPYSNTGRGYIQGRYRSLNMLYLESEYRFGITPNGLLGGVVFANAESFTEPGSDRYEYIQPGYGLGIRISLNKFSRTNLCIDYGWGSHGSSGFFVNLGEVF
jgi:outer membrane protein assembly factor BamA